MSISFGKKSAAEALNLISKIIHKNLILLNA